VKIPLATFPEESVAEQDTGVAPRAKVEPDGGEQATTGDESARSVAVAEKVREAPLGLVASAIMSAGRDRIGSVVSTTVTVETTEPVLPNASVAVHVTVVAPREKVEPEIGEQVV